MSKKTKWSLISIISAIAYVCYAEFYLFAALNHWQVNDWLQVNAYMLVLFGWVAPMLCIMHRIVNL